jgi:CheY-like chemotaxis protein
MRIVVAEDHQDGAEILALVLEELGHHVELADTGERAVALCAALAPQVAFVDLTLPDIEGFEVARLVRARAPGTVLVALTGMSSPDLRAGALEVGFAHFLVKPLRLEDLEQLLQNIGALRQG